MKRSIYRQLLEWKASANRKPMMLYGARQVGKTYILKEFGRNEFDNLVYINCYKNQAIETLFAEDKDVSRILLGLSALSGQEITEGKTLIFLDEIQEVPDVVASLKYFCEDAPGIFIVTAGSLLGVMNMAGKPFPTGKVNILHMYPMTFDEFIEAMGEDKMLSVLQDPAQHNLVNSLLPNYIELLRQYYFVGGMPEAVGEFINSHTPASVRKIQLDILSAYEADIAKHAGKDTPKARLVFESIPSQLTKENKKFCIRRSEKRSPCRRIRKRYPMACRCRPCLQNSPPFKGRAANIILYGQGYIQAVCTRCWAIGRYGPDSPLYDADRQQRFLRL